MAKEKDKKVFLEDYVGNMIKSKSGAISKRKHRIHRLKVREYPLGRNLINW